MWQNHAKDKTMNMKGKGHQTEYKLGYTVRNTTCSEALIGLTAYHA